MKARYIKLKANQLIVVFTNWFLLFRYIHKGRPLSMLHFPCFVTAVGEPAAFRKCSFHFSSVHFWPGIDWSTVLSLSILTKWFCLVLLDTLFLVFVAVSFPHHPVELHMYTSSCKFLASLFNLNLLLQVSMMYQSSKSSGKSDEWFKSSEPKPKDWCNSVFWTNQWNDKIH